MGNGGVLLRHEFVMKAGLISGLMPDTDSSGRSLAVRREVALRELRTGPNRGSAAPLVRIAFTYGDNPVPDAFVSGIDGRGEP